MYYVIQVKTGQEDKTMEDIRKIAAGDPYFEVFSPYRKGLRKYKGVMKEVKERCFPGYLFVETNEIERLFRDLYAVPDFTRLLGGQDNNNRHFEALNEGEARMIEILYGHEHSRVTPLSEISFGEGDKITVISGPLLYMEGKIKKMNLHKRKATIEVSLFDRAIETEVGIDIIAKIN